MDTLRFPKGMIPKRFSAELRFRLACLLFVPFLLLGSISCTEKEVDTVLAEEVEQKQEVLEELKRELTAKSDETRKVANEVSDMESAIRNLQRSQKQELEVTKEFNDLKNYQDEVNATLALLDAGLNAWRDASRLSMAGLRLGVVDLGGGKILNDAVVVEVMDGKVRLSNQGAESVVEITALPMETRERLVDESLVLQKIQLEQAQK